jgi:hypothetical protein
VPFSVVLMSAPIAANGSVTRFIGLPDNDLIAG